MQRSGRMNWRAILATGVALAACTSRPVRADRLVYDTPEGRRTVEGKLAAQTNVEMLFLGRDGRMHLLDAKRAVELAAREHPGYLDITYQRARYYISYYMK